MSKEEIRKLVDADSLEYLPAEALDKICPDSRLGFCKACFCR